jgi:hypothetical protein
MIEKAAWDRQEPEKHLTPTISMSSVLPSEPMRVVGSNGPFVPEFNEARGNFTRIDVQHAKPNRTNADYLDLPTNTR